jgi:hypothetical protein
MQFSKIKLTKALGDGIAADREAVAAGAVVAQMEGPTFDPFE